MSNGFSMKDGDVIVARTIEMVEDPELLRQKVERVIGTALGEWVYDPQEGIDRSVVICKNPDDEKIRATIEEALLHIDDTFAITAFSLEMEGRAATITFTAINSDSQEIGVTYTYAD